MRHCYQGDQFLENVEGQTDQWLVWLLGKACKVLWKLQEIVEYCHRCEYGSFQRAVGYNADSGLIQVGIHFNLMPAASETDMNWWKLVAYSNMLSRVVMFLQWSPCNLRDFINSCQFFSVVVLFNWKTIVWSSF